MSELLLYSVGAAGVLWATGFGIGLAFGYIRRIRDVV
jgi:hypothetical protein